MNDHPETDHPGTATETSVSIRGYAKLRGYAPSAVIKAVKTNRLRDSVVRSPEGKVQIDVALADREWARNTDLSRAPLAHRQNRMAIAHAISHPKSITAAQPLITQPIIQREVETMGALETFQAERDGDVVYIDLSLRVSVATAREIGLRLLTAIDELSSGAAVEH